MEYAVSIMAREFFQEWRVADRAASAAERALMAASIAAIEAHEQPPSLEEIAHAKRLRAIANDLFAVSMAEFTERVNVLQRPAP